MEANKENVARSLTKIPLPKKTLLPLPAHLLSDGSKKALEANSRKPLDTLNKPVPKQSEPRKRVSSPLRIDSRYVTVRRNKEELDRDVSLICEQVNSTVIVISDDEDDYDDQDDVLNTGFLILDSDEEQGVTSNSKTLELKTANNIKVPHSLSQTGYTKQILPYLLETEKNLLDVPRVPTVTRTCIINWLIKLDEKVGHHEIVQAAVKYFDTILMENDITINKLHLLGVTCYWIAHKLNKQSLTATKMVVYFGTIFTVTQLIDAEKEVLEILSFPCLPVVEQDFITFFTRSSVENAPDEIEMAATFLCMSGILLNKALGKEYPSAVAAAAVKNAVKLLEKEEQTLKRLESLPVYELAVGKTDNFENLCFQLCEAVYRLSTLPEKSTLLEIYGVQPFFAAQKILLACEKQMMK